MTTTASSTFAASTTSPGPVTLMEANNSNAVAAVLNCIEGAKEAEDRSDNNLHPMSAGHTDNSEMDRASCSGKVDVAAPPDEDHDCSPV